MEYDVVFQALQLGICLLVLKVLIQVGQHRFFFVERFLGDQANGDRQNKIENQRR